MAPVSVDDVFFGALLSTYSARTARTSANRFGTLVLAFTLVFGPTGAPKRKTQLLNQCPKRVLTTTV